MICGNTAQTGEQCFALHSLILSAGVDMQTATRDVSSKVHNICLQIYMIFDFLQICTKILIITDLLSKVLPLL